MLAIGQSSRTDLGWFSCVTAELNKNHKGKFFRLYFFGYIFSLTKPARVYRDRIKGLILRHFKASCDAAAMHKPQYMTDYIPPCSISWIVAACGLRQLNLDQRMHAWALHLFLPLMVMSNGTRGSRSVSNGKLMEDGRSDKAKATFINDATRAWNKVPANIRECTSLYSAKKAITTFVKTLPV